MSAPPATRYRMLVGNGFTGATGGRELPAIDPYTDEEIARIPDATAEDVDAAVAAARGRSARRGRPRPVWNGPG